MKPFKTFMPIAVLLAFTCNLPESCYYCGPLVPPGQIANGDVAFEVKESSGSLPISPLIYGTNRRQDNPGVFPFRRIGGEGWSAYNWERNTREIRGHNNKFDYPASESPASDRGAAVRFRAEAPLSRGEKVLITVPLLPYVAIDDAGPVSVDAMGRPIAATPEVLSTHYEPSSATGGTSDGALEDQKVFQNEFVNWIKTEFSQYVDGDNGSLYFSLDNEPDLWGSTHKPLHPNPPTYSSVTDKHIEYARMIKSQAGKALVFGPAVANWYGINNLNLGRSPGTDYSTLGTFSSYYLKAMATASSSEPRPLLDVLDFHWYPEDTVRVDADRNGTEETFYQIDQDDPTAADIPNATYRASVIKRIRAKRMQAPRALWDATYRGNSRIEVDQIPGQPIMILPRLNSDITKYFSGRKLAVTEYYFGGRHDMSGAVAQADALGAFVRHRVFAASLWESAENGPDPIQPYIYAAFAMYRDFDGNGGHFGPAFVNASSSSNLDSASIHASNGLPDHSIVAVALNRGFGDDVATLKIRSCMCYDNFSIFRLMPGPPPGPVAANNLIREEKLNALRFTLPGQSVLTIVAHRKDPTLGDFFQPCGWALPGWSNRPGIRLTPLPVVDANQPDPW